MGVFRSKSKAAGITNVNQIDIKISSKDEDNYKVNSAVHDPILTAVNEQQPFEQAAQRDNRRPSYLSQSSQELKDIFGNPIVTQDISNPTRSRNERPLDTIRSFEYAITGDMSYRNQLESHKLGWNFHDDFNYYHQYPNQPPSSSSNQVNNQNYNDFYKPPTVDQPIYQAGNYSASSLQANGNKKKKKKGLFGRNK